MLLLELSKIYHNYLFTPQNKNVVDYLKSRGLTAKTLKKYQVGYSNYNIGYKHVSKKYSDKQLIESGVFGFKDGKMYDLFFKKITFPIIYNKVVKHMTSRVYPEWGNLKHLHQRGDINYAFNHDALKDDYVIIVEGPIDCLTLAQNGFSSIGLLGAYRITREIINDLQGKKVFIVFDKEENETGDNAGLKLSKKLIQYNIRPRIINLPFEGDKTDVNSYFQNHNVNQFGELIKTSKPFDIRKEKRRKSTNFNNSYDIIPVAEKYLELRYIGGKYKCICPFHPDGDPSLVFYPETNSFYCFGCNSHGNTVTLIKKLEEQKGNNISYSKAEEMIGR